MLASVAIGDVEARAFSALAHLGLRVVEGFGLPNSAGIRRVSATVSAMAVHWADRALARVVSGNRRTFLEQQRAELILMRAIVHGHIPAADVERHLEVLRARYDHANERRGRANIRAALALDAIARRDFPRARSLLDEAEQLYLRDGEIDEAGAKLLARRRALLASCGSVSRL